MNQRLNIVASYLLISFLVLALGVPSVWARSTQETRQKQTPNFFNSKDVDPEGNAALHYIDSRLQKLNSNDPQALEAIRKAVAEDPNSPYLLAELARHLAETDQFEQATLYTQKALEKAPGQADLYLLKGKLHSVKKESELAVQAYDICIQKDPLLEDCYLMKSREFMLQRDLETSRKILEGYIKLKPRAVQARYLLGTLQTQKASDFPKAIAQFNKILEVEPKHVKSLSALSQIHLKEKNYPEALKALIELEQVAPTDVATKLRIGLIFYEQDNYPEAIKRFSRVLELQPENDRVHYYLGVLESQNENYDQALKYFGQIEPQSEYYKDSIIRRVVAYGQMEQFPKAIKTTKKALKIKKDMPELYHLLGNLYSQQEKYSQALKAYQKGLKKFPSYEKLLFGKGVLQDKMGDTPGSMETMGELLKVNPDHAQALNYLGYTLVDRDQKLTEALKMLQKAHQLRPKDGYITDSLAWAHYKMGNTDKALELLNEANQQSPEEATILEHLGDIYLKLGQAQRALSYYQEAVAAAIKAKPQDKREREELQRIRSKLAKVQTDA